MANAPPPPVLDGDVVAAKYRIDGVVGRGGMGVVVAATHLHLGTRVALKFLRTEDSVSEAALARFRREARAAGQLRSEHAVRVFDVGSLPTGEPYLVMELLEGADLADVLADVLAASSELPLEDIVAWILQACDAVGEAHAAGIVHRDLKPRNLFLAKRTGEAGQIKVLDFGIAKSLPRRGELDLTGTAEVLGSPVYMAPEQLRASRDVDERTDIWALGVILYELVSGRRPYVGETMSQVTASILEDTPPALRDLRPDTPFELARVIAKCMTKDPAGRFGSIGELRAALAPLLTSPMGSPRARIDLSSSGAAPTSLSWADTERAPPPPRGVRARALPLFVGLSALALVGAGIAVVRFGALHWAVPTAAASASPTVREVATATETPPPPAVEPLVASAAPRPGAPLSSASAKKSVVTARPRAPTRDIADAGAPPTLGPTDFPAARK